MNLQRYATSAAILFFVTTIASLQSLTLAQTKEPSKSAAIDVITAEELKAKFNRKEPITVLDVRSSDAYVGSDNKIKGAIHVKLRKLKFRLGYPPLKNVPRDREIVTYCSCPSDETSMRAAEILADAGFKRVRVLKGGWQGWLQVSGQVEARPRGM